MSNYRIAVVTCSTRPSRLNPFVTQFVQNFLKDDQPNATLSVLDLNDYSLPLLDEPAVPSQLPRDDPTPHYVHDHTKKWSTIVRQFDAFIFVTPQYNWSVPASLKNAIDYLYYEWYGKPAAIVSYGTRGGPRAAGHLRQMLMGVRMHVVETATELVIDRKSMARSVAVGEMSEEDKARWREAGAEDKLRSGLQEVVGLLKEPKEITY